MSKLDLSFVGGESSLSVRRFVAHEEVSGLFEVVVEAVSLDASLDIGAMTGHGAGLSAVPGYQHVLDGGARMWTGICSRLTQVQAEPTGVSTYQLVIVPRLWLTTHRRNYRLFQQKSLVDIVTILLEEWQVKHRWVIDRAQYPTLDLKVQYGESDYAFICRLLEEAGIAFYFVAEGGVSLLVLHDDPCTEAERPGEAITYTDHPNQASQQEYVTRVQLGQAVRSGGYAIRDSEFRKPRFAVLAEADKAEGLEGGYERFDYRPGAFLVEGHAQEGTPVADGRGVARHSLAYGQGQAQRSLDAVRTGNHHVRYQSNVMDLWPGRLFAIDHVRAELSPNIRLMAVSQSIEGSATGEWSMSGTAVFAERAYRPARRTAIPIIDGVQSATVVGPKGEEIHTDEYGRVRVQFPWEREGKNDEYSSCWLRVNQGWAGTGYGWLHLPRIGQEVLVSFMGGNPDRPVVVGRVFNQTNPVPYKLPKHKKYSTLKTESSPGSAGHNEIRYEDEKGEELVYLQAEKNRRKWVKNDEVMTIGHDRHKLVKRDEQDTTDGNRTEVTHENRRESTFEHRYIAIGGNHEQTVNQDENVRTTGAVQVLVGGEQDLVVKRVQKDRVHSDVHLQVYGERRQKIDGSQSLTVGESQQERIRGRHAVDAGTEIYLHSGGKMVFEGVEDITFKAPGGFVRINDEGIIIDGKVVKINSGGSPGSGSGASPDVAQDAKAKKFQIPVEEVVELLNTAQKHGVVLPELPTQPEFVEPAKPVVLQNYAMFVSILREQGRDSRRIAQVLDSGLGFQSYEFKKGDKLFALVSSDDARKEKFSPYWLNEATYRDLVQRHDLSSQEGRLAIKQELALPCSNDASRVVCTTVTMSHQGLASRVAPQMEKKHVIDEDGSYGEELVSLKGGGTQFTPYPKALSNVVLLGGDA